MQKLRSDRFGKPKTETLDGHEDNEKHPVMQYFKEGKSKEVRRE